MRLDLRWPSLFVAVLAALPIVGLVAAPSSALPAGASCPSGVDTGDEGWICALLIIDGLNEAPANADITRWADQLAHNGRRAVAHQIIFGDAPVDADITTLYQTQLHREPDAGGLAYWRNEVQDLGTELVVEFGVFNSAEYLAQFGSVDAFVDAQYQYFLGRHAGGEEQRYWAGLVDAGLLADDGITYAVAVSQEAGEVRARTLYRDYALRAPDPGGLGYWGSIAAARGLLGPAVDFASSSEPVAALGAAGVNLAGNGGPPSTPQACLAQLPIDRLIDRVLFLLVAEGADISGAIDHIGGVDLIGPYDGAGLRSLGTELDGAAVPPLLASDEEGGRVQRLDQVLGSLSSAAAISGMPLSEARSTYQSYAQGMADLGIDLNFAPVLATGARALGDRSYGDDPDVVSERAGLFVDAMHRAGVLPVLKHFPGLGDATTNTDDGAATGPNLDQLRNRDLIPYQRLVPDGPVAVMMSHLQVPDLTGNTPASLSPAVYDLLRDEIGFDGLVITDSLSARAITATWTVPDASVRALAAGADMVLFGDPTQVDSVHAAIRRAVDDGSLPGIRLQRAAGAVLETQGVDPCRLLGS